MLLLKYFFTSTETVGGTGAQDGHLTQLLSSGEKKTKTKEKEKKEKTTTTTTTTKKKEKEKKKEKKKDVGSKTINTKCVCSLDYPSVISLTVTVDVKHHDYFCSLG